MVTFTLNVVESDRFDFCSILSVAQVLKLPMVSFSVWKFLVTFWIRSVERASLLLRGLVLSRLTMLSPPNLWDPIWTKLLLSGDVMVTRLSTIVVVRLQLRRRLARPLFSLVCFGVEQTRIRWSGLKHCLNRLSVLVQCRCRCVNIVGLVLHSVVSVVLCLFVRILCSSRTSAVTVAFF